MHEDPDSYRADRQVTAKFSAPWNSLFAVVSPLLIDEASDGALKRALDRFVEEQRAEAQKNDASFKEYTLKRFSLSEEDFNTIKVQFLALKLISRSSKKKTRSVSDRNAYWMLTPYGETVMIGLRAIKRS